MKVGVRVRPLNAREKALVTSGSATATVTQVSQANGLENYNGESGESFLLLIINYS